MAPARAIRAHIVVLQAFIDETFNHQKGIFVLGGYISPDHKWASFDREWKKLLPFGGMVDEKGRPHFKMSKLARKKDGLRKSKKFYEVIEDYCETAVSVQFAVKDLESAISRILIPAAPR